MSALDRYRSEKDDFFANNPQSPFTPEQRKDFPGIRYFSENKNLRLELQVEEFDVKKPSRDPNDHRGNEELQPFW